LPECCPNNRFSKKEGSTDVAKWQMQTDLNCIFCRFYALLDRSNQAAFTWVNRPSWCIRAESQTASKNVLSLPQILAQLSKRHERRQVWYLAVKERSWSHQILEACETESVLVSYLMMPTELKMNSKRKHRIRGK
jgi:hypothetical protein